MIQKNSIWKPLTAARINFCLANKGPQDPCALDQGGVLQTKWAWQSLYCNTLISCVTDTFLCHSTAAASTMHRAAPVATAANPRAQGAAACTVAPGGERPQLTLQVRHRDALAALVFIPERLRPAFFPSPTVLGWHTYQVHSWLCPTLAHPGGKSWGLCWTHGRHHPEDAQHSFYPLQSNVKVLSERMCSPAGQRTLPSQLLSTWEALKAKYSTWVDTEFKA